MLLWRLFWSSVRLAQVVFQVTKRRMFFVALAVVTTLGILLFEFFVLKTIEGGFSIHFLSYGVASDLKQFLQQTPALKDRLLLIDRNILQTYQDTIALNNDNCIFCNVKSFTPVAFALICPSNASLEEHILLPILKAWEIGFWVETIINSSPKKFSAYKSNLPLGFILQKRKGAVVIEIVLLHEREGDFWWHGSLFQDLHYKAKLENLKVTDIQNDLVLSREGAFDKFLFESVIIDENKLSVPKNIPIFLKESSHFIECNYELADKFYRTYGKDTTFKALNFIHKARKTLSSAKAVLDQLQIPFWLSSGTLLGYYRQCDVIPYSADVDLGIFIKDFNESIIEGMKSRNMKLMFRLGRVNDSFELSFLNNRVKLDIFFFYDDGDNYYNAAHEFRLDKKIPPSKYKFTFPKFTLCWTEFLEMKVRLPCETERYIRANYGPNWFTPVVAWDSFLSPFNGQKVGTWKPEEVDDVIKIYDT